MFVWVLIESDENNTHDNKGKLLPFREGWVNDEFPISARSPIVAEDCPPDSAWRFACIHRYCFPL